MTTALLYGDDLDGSVRMFTEVLGFGESEKVMDGDLQLASFLYLWYEGS